VQSPKSSAKDQPAEPASPQRKNWWEAALTSTPIVLTVLATALAGLSTSEMTLAQYHRSLAAQNQAKAGDQWGFFQAKRLRETSMEIAGDLVLARFKSSQVSPSFLNAGLGRLVKELQRGERETDQLVQSLDSASKTRLLRRRIRQSAEELAKTAKDAATKAGNIQQQLSQLLDREQVSRCLAYLASDQLPEVQDAPIDSPDIEKAIQAISDRLPESELASLVRKIKEDDLNRAIETAEANARRFENAAKPAGKVLDDIDKLLNQLVVQAGCFHKAARALSTSSEPFIVDNTEGATDLQKIVSQFDRVDAGIQAAAEELANSFKAGRYDYTARRQGREASYNLKSAGLYEVQVRLNSLNSERHRTRSKLFFFGMLGAQAGVTIASLSLAVRQRNVLWGLAALAGIGAVLFCGYVYLYM
jgi:hypothetical protein